MLFQAPESLAASAKTLALLSLFAAVRYKKNPESIDKSLSPSLYSPIWSQSVSKIPFRTAGSSPLVSLPSLWIRDTTTTSYAHLGKLIMGQQFVPTGKYIRLMLSMQDLSRKLASLYTGRKSEVNETAALACAARGSRLAVVLTADTFATI
jgi:hypothetical protein